jgi:hypothetical protein
MKSRHVPQKRIPESLKEKILQDGLIHFTRYQDALNIQKEGLIAGKKKPMYNKEKEMVWLYINSERLFDENKKNVLSKGKRSEYDAAVIFNEITELQIENMRIRDNSDNAIVHVGDFKSESIEIRNI